MLFVDAMLRSKREHGYRLFAWVVMPEHVHLLVQPPAQKPLEPALRSMKMIVSRRALAWWRELGTPLLERLRTNEGEPRFWQAGGGFDRNVRNQAELSRAIRYIHRNPVERGLVSTAERWRWSSVRWWMGQRGGEVSCDPVPGITDQWRGFV